MQQGDRVNWAYTPRGGYGFTTQVAGVLLKRTAKRATVRVALKVNGAWTQVERSVKLENLTPRKAPCVELGETN